MVDEDILQRVEFDSPAKVFGSYTYWSSSEFSANNAWRQSCGTGVRENAAKVLSGNVRAIRSF